MQQLINYIYGALLAVDSVIILLVMLADLLSKDISVRNNLGKALFAITIVTISLIYLGV